MARFVRHACVILQMCAVRQEYSQKERNSIDVSFFLEGGGEGANIRVETSYHEHTLIRINASKSVRASQLMELKSHDDDTISSDTTSCRAGCISVICALGKTSVCD